VTIAEREAVKRICGLLEWGIVGWNKSAIKGNVLNP
jgi:hypothetical protein